MDEINIRVNVNLKAGIPFAVYAKPGSDSVSGIFQKDTTAYFLTDFNEPGFVFASFDGYERLIIPADGSEIITAPFESKKTSLPEIGQPDIDPLAKTAFEALVTKSIEAINEGNFEKLVCSRSENVAHDTDYALIYLKLLQAYPNAFRYWFFHPKAGMWMGATPEQLVKAEGTAINTVALAGTQLYKEGQEAVWPGKEQEEQLFVTDYIANELDGLVNDIRITQPYTFRAGNIVHIKTDLSAKMKDGASLKKIIEKLHPTPAVCGLPKEEAKQFLLQNEGYDREYYSGFMGELNFDFATRQTCKTDLFVNLRCMKINENTAQLFIGCGITKDSDPEKEFIETVNKSMTMRKVLL